MRSEAEPGTRVVMMVANPFTHDTRVEKEARTLVESGFDVHVVAFLRPGLPAREERDGVIVHRLRVGPSSWRGLALLASSLVDRPALPHRLIQRVGLRPLSQRSTVTQAAVRRRSPLVRRAYARVRVARGGRSVRPPAAVPMPPSPAGVSPAGGRLRAAVRWRYRRVRRPIILARAALRRRWRALRRAAILARAAVRWRVARRLRARAPAAVRRALRLGHHGSAGRADSFLADALRRLSLYGRILNANVDFARIALALEPQVVHAHDLNTVTAGVIVKELSGAGLVYDSHELFLERNIGLSSRALDRRVWGPVERHGILRCDEVISVSEGICRTLEQRYGIERVSLVRNVQPYEPPPSERSAFFHEELLLEPGTRVAIYAGGVVRHRGLETMIDCSPYLGRTVFVIMGYAHQQSYLQSLEARASDLGMLGSKVFFQPAVPTDKVLGYVAAADLGMVPTENVCLSYYFEASNKIFHCVMAGVPLAMSDHPEKRLLVERHGVGIVFDETRPPAEIAREIEEFLDDRTRYGAAQRACAQAARVLNWEHEEETLRGVYKRLDVGGAGGRPLVQSRRA